MKTKLNNGHEKRRPSHGSRRLLLNGGRRPQQGNRKSGSKLRLPIEELSFTVRTYNCLKGAEIVNVGRLVQCTEHDLTAIRNFGQKSLDEVKTKLKGIGLSLKTGDRTPVNV